jgi:hypothetical protein
MARFDDDPALIAAIRDGVREMHRKYAATGRYDGHDLINWLNEHRNKELDEIYKSYEDSEDPEMIADQQLGWFLYRLGQKKLDERLSDRRMSRPDRTRNGTCKVSVWKIAPDTMLGNPDDRFASIGEREEFEDVLEQKAIHRLALRNAIGRAEDVP